ncbi:RDD family protein [Salimicrobium flavidum]|uniref:RDD family protein n=1 Tax=Salimicrobium flavidum TaxID=570947 RepID=A0A1N7JJG2_9BACI|nr:RDD family protein [Salimicrobium flavidum]SIS49459.1 RDD family protein [Salimicrobium flavidum]
MEPITKKRTYAVLIDMALSNLVVAGVEAAIRKKVKVKNEAVHNLLNPTLITWGLEYAQLKCCSQTVGYKLMGLKLESEDGSPLTSSQIIRRMAYRDFASSISYMKDKENFTQDEGRSLPQDRFSHTIVKTKST